MGAPVSRARAGPIIFVIVTHRVMGPRPSAPRHDTPPRQVLERLRQDTTGEELLVSRDELARIVREQIEAAVREAS
jgi:uncharacterized protein (DUF433 family)